MGKTVDLLKQIEELRSGKVSAVIPPTEKSRINFIWLIGALLIFAILLSLFIGTKAFLMTKNSGFDNRSTIIRLKKMDESLNNASKQIALINQKIDLVYSKLGQTQQETSLHASEINSLNKTKNTLLNKIDTLQSDFQRLKTNKK